MDEKVSHLKACGNFFFFFFFFKKVREFQFRFYS